MPYFCNVDEDIINTVEAEIREDVDWNKVIDDIERVVFLKMASLEMYISPNGKMGSGEEGDVLPHNCVVIFVQDHAINDGVGDSGNDEKFYDYPQSTSL